MALVPWDNEALQEQTIGCPYCGEMIDVLLNQEDVGIDYIEDCQVCCRPIEMSVFEAGDGSLAVTVRTDSD